MDPVVFLPSGHLIFEKKSDNEVAMSTLKITNTLPDQRVVFRIQTTSPNSYRVRPSIGLVGPMSTVEIKISMLYPRTGDKFQIKYAPTPLASTNGDAEDINLIYQSVESIVKDHKKACAFLGEATFLDDKLKSGSKEDIPNERGLSPVLSDRGTSISAMPQDVTGLKFELKEARVKIQQLISRNQELSQRLERGESGESSLPRWLIDALNSHNGIPPVLVFLIGLFCFLIGLTF